MSRLLRDTHFELMPLGTAIEQARAVAAGRHVTVTCSPRHGLDRTIDLAVCLKELGLEVTPHVAARMVRGHGHLEEVVERLDQAGITSVFVIGGDAEPPTAPFASAGALLEQLSALQHRFTQVGIGAYPEGHLLINNEALWAALTDKSAYATYITTQLCFDASKLVTWLDRLRTAGVALPVRIGLPGAVQRKKLIEISLRVGVGPSIRYLRKQRSLFSALAKRGAYDPTELLAPLSRAAAEHGLGLAGLHLFTFNQLTDSVAWRDDTLATLEYGDSAEALQH